MYLERMPHRRHALCQALLRCEQLNLKQQFHPITLFLSPRVGCSCERCKARHLIAPTIEFEHDPVDGHACHF
eukprot:9384681-Alexandrium_andersonii.AAC.1